MINRRQALLTIAAGASTLLEPPKMNAQELKSPELKSKDWIAYVGTYTKGASRGIYALRFDPATARLMPLGVAAQTVSPSFLALHPNGRVLYAVNESRRYSGISNSGSLSAYSIDFKTGSLTLLNAVPTRGADPCHLAFDRTGRWVFVANYSGGSIAVFPVQENGAVGELAQLVQREGSTMVDPVRQEAPHVHSVDISPDNRFLYVSDLGNDEIVVYDFDAATGQLKQRSAAMLKPGSGPRHIAFSRDRRYLYSLEELNATITVFRHDIATGRLEELQVTSTLPPGYNGEKSGAEIAIDSAGLYLYASNRGHNSIAVFSIDAEQGLLIPAGHASTIGKTPRHFAITPDAKHLVAANQDSSDLVTFAIDPNTGALTPVGEPLKVPEPVCVLFVQVP